MSQFPDQQPTFPTPTKQPGDGLATASLVLGIIGFLISFILGGIPFGIAGIICGMVAMGKGFRGGKLIAGLILSILGLLFSIGTIIACVACVNSPFWLDFLDEFWREWDYIMHGI
ncbi:MAG: hypothetical protein FWE21_05400 [Defluviitaleaceae bacterium]|nr:hypothetical protein [Defluviitaleaceae bacterium]